MWTSCSHAPPATPTRSAGTSANTLRRYPPTSWTISKAFPAVLAGEQAAESAASGVPHSSRSQNHCSTSIRFVASRHALVLIFGLTVTRTPDFFLTSGSRFSAAHLRN
jgi:hypothetical protein